MKYGSEYHYAEVVNDKIIYEDEIYSPSKLVLISPSIKLFTIALDLDRLA